MKFKFSGIVIFGGMGSGKDTYTQFILTELIKNNINCSSYNIGDLCREVMKIGKVNSNWKHNNRELAQTAASKLREIDTNLLNDYTLSRVFSDLEKLNPSVNYYDTNKTLKEFLIQNTSTLLPIIIGGRTEDDFKYWSSLGFLTVGITSSNSSKHLETRDLGQVQNGDVLSHPTEIDTHYIASSLCDIHLENNSNLIDFEHKSINTLKQLNLIR